jgi:hypothetical protein
MTRSKIMLQYRTSTDQRAYNPNRDVAHNFKEVAMAVAKKVQNGDLAELHTFISAAGVTEDDLGAACAAFCKFVGSAADPEHRSMQTSLELSGWFDVPPLAQVAIMAALGTAFLGIQFVGVREATLGGQGPAMEMREVLQASEELLKLLQSRAHVVVN